MKNRKLFSAVVILFLLTALSVPFAAGIFYDPDNGQVFADSWTYWDFDQPDISIPYLDVWTTVWGINNTHDVRLTVTDLYYSGSPYDQFENEGYGTFKDISYPIPAPDAYLYNSQVTSMLFN